MDADSESPWQFWLDVGGTFTDCIARTPSGQFFRQKVLSSGAIAGSVETAEKHGQFFDSERHEVAGFFTNYRVRFFDTAGKQVTECCIADSNGHRLLLDTPVEVQSGWHYELSCDEDAPLVAVRQVLQRTLHQELPRIDMRLGTTRGTNALLTRRGARIALLTTEGFTDLPTIGNQDRRHLFELSIQPTMSLAEKVVGVRERMTPDGKVLLPLDETQVRQQIKMLAEAGYEGLSICLLNAYANDAHERQLIKLARDAGFTSISASHQVSPLIKMVARMDTTTVDAYLNPILRNYLQRIERTLPKGSRLQLMTSAGGIVPASSFTGKDSILSGPAGGVVGAAGTANAAGHGAIIGFDMGGTSTDVSRCAGPWEMQYETEKANVRLSVPMMAIETVAAGGGSLCRFDGVKFVVGPDSAGADPGPACYGRGGPLTVTDMNCYLGRIAEQQFPFPLNRQSVEDKLKKLAAQVKADTGQQLSLAEIAEGCLEIANANMTAAIRSISNARGYDARGYTLAAFGGAAGQHACAVASNLGIKEILIHGDAGILSALGIGLADTTRTSERGLYKLVTELSESEWNTVFEDLRNAATEMLQEDSGHNSVDQEQQFEYRVDVRYRGTDSYLTIATDQPDTLQDRFVKEHLRQFGYELERPLEVGAVRATLRRRSGYLLPRSERTDSRLRTSWESHTAVFGGQSLATFQLHRNDLQAGDYVTGPAIIADDHGTIVVEPGWSAERLTGGDLLVYRMPPGDQSQSSQSQVDTGYDPVRLEVFNQRLAGIANEMGITLQKTACSVNVKERLDFSCAVFTATGDLVVNAPHIPVHLGAMSETVKALLGGEIDLNDGDVFLTNDPYHGGSHLPDLTVITPIFESDQLRFVVASRAHHAEIGGIAPGSMPPLSTNLAQEGVLCRNERIVRNGELLQDHLYELFVTRPEYPTRNFADNLSDLCAQIAANRRGAEQLRGLIDAWGWEATSHNMQLIQWAAETKTRRALRAMPDGNYSFQDHLDDGSVIQVRISITGDDAVVDFNGTSPVLSSNLNANRAIVSAATLYVFRCLINEEIPLNQGVLAPIQLQIPDCLLNPPEHADPADCAAVAGGNVETSQRVVDVLLGALQLAAASQGTMNNVLFGNERFGYYETICGGVGATADSPGASAVHTHMTNTRITDPEVLEQRYPVRLRQFSIRHGSGGAGKKRGGDGAVREFEFLEPLRLSLLTQRRGDFPPYGCNGGEPGAPGRNVLERQGEPPRILGGIEQIDVQAGDRLRIETPGGGGWGTRPSQD